MKNVLGVLGLTVTTACVGWSFGSGHMDPATTVLAIISWIAIGYSCMED